MYKLPKHEKILKPYECVETDPSVRWREGFPHHPKSMELMQHLGALDFEFFNDYFCWKTGGDGDNGETLMYALDMYFEMKDIFEEKTFVHELAQEIAKFWIGEADKHIIEPQIKELECLTADQLIELFKVIDIDDLPDSMDEDLKGVAARISKRCRISKSIREAEEKGLYELAEHLVSNIEI